MSYQNELNHAFLRVESSLISLHAMKVEGKAGDVLKDQENGKQFHSSSFLSLLYSTAAMSTDHVTYIIIPIPFSPLNSFFLPYLFSTLFTNNNSCDKACAGNVLLLGELCSDYTGNKCYRLRYTLRNHPRHELRTCR